MCMRAITIRGPPFFNGTDTNFIKKKYSYFPLCKCVHSIYGTLTLAQIYQKQRHMCHPLNPMHFVNKTQNNNNNILEGENSTLLEENIKIFQPLIKLHCKLLRG